MVGLRAERCETGAVSEPLTAIGQLSDLSRHARSFRVCLRPDEPSLCPPAPAVLQAERQRWLGSMSRLHREATDRASEAERGQLRLGADMGAMRAELQVGVGGWRAGGCVALCITKYSYAGRAVGGMECTWTGVRGVACAW